mmetsp:Transcript_56323/g.175093  ORF Transcript_56323/g.175093 Transcript_56323/m.175093 type:complete len:156 (+) Transcript_56323:163-630(+)
MASLTDMQPFADHTAGRRAELNTMAVMAEMQSPRYGQPSMCGWAGLPPSAEVDAIMIASFHQDTFIGDNLNNIINDLMEEVETAMNEVMERCIEQEIALDDDGPEPDSPECAEVPLPRLHPWNGASLEPCPEPDPLNTAKLVELPSASAWHLVEL